MAEVVVRRALLSDAARLVKLRRALFAETHFMLLEPKEFKSTAKDEAHRIRFFEAKSNALLLVAEDGQDSSALSTPRRLCLCQGSRQWRRRSFGKPKGAMSMSI